MVTPTDIANRALQRVGSAEIEAGALLTEDSRNANQVRLCYEILRRSELRRNVWRFSIRTVALRAFDQDEDGNTLSKVVEFGLYSDAATYAINDIVTGSDGQTYQSLAATNIGFSPLSRPDKWTLYFGSMVAQAHDTDLEYYAGELVYISTTLYRSKISANGNTPPHATWMTFTTVPALADPNFVYPIGSSPRSQSNGKKAFQLPNGYMREAAQDPKNGSVSAFASGNSYKDWLFESNYLLSQFPGPILFRFAADVRDTNMFDPLFVEGFASRIAFEVCEPLTQSSSKLNDMGNEYQKFMSEARIVNGIETGTVEPPVDNYIACRV